MKLVLHLLSKKDTGIVSVTPDASVLDAIKLMAERGIGSLLVMRGDTMAGIVTERDYARKVIVMGRSSESTTVSEIMTADVLSVPPDKTVNACMALMSERKIRHLPVVDNDKVLGMLSMRDLVQAIIADQKDEIEQLEHYISG
jgi:CBS domain-containing protein